MGKALARRAIGCKNGLLRSPVDSIWKSLTQSTLVLAMWLAKGRKNRGTEICMPLTRLLTDLKAVEKGMLALTCEGLRDEIEGPSLGCFERRGAKGNLFCDGSTCGRGFRDGQEGRDNLLPWLKRACRLSLLFPLKRF